MHLHRFEGTTGYAEVWTYHPDRAAPYVGLEISDDEHLRMTPSEARALGHTLIAAAAQAERAGTSLEAVS